MNKVEIRNGSTIQHTLNKKQPEIKVTTNRSLKINVVTAEQNLKSYDVHSLEHPNAENLKRLFDGTRNSKL